MYEMLIITREGPRVDINRYGRRYGPGNEKALPTGKIGDALAAALADGWEPMSHNMNGMRQESFVFRRAVKGLDVTAIPASPVETTPKKRGRGRPKKDTSAE